MDDGQPEEDPCAEGHTPTEDGHSCAECGSILEDETDDVADSVNPPPGDGPLSGLVSWTTLLVLVGFIAGGVAFAGYFIDFASIAREGSVESLQLSQTSSDLFYIVPVAAGLSTLGLLVVWFGGRLPGFVGRLLAGGALLACGTAIGFWGYFAEVNAAYQRADRVAPVSPSTGFWMIVIGSIVLFLAWVVLPAGAAAPADREPEGFSEEGESEGLTEAGESEGLTAGEPETDEEGSGERPAADEEVP